MRWVDLGDIKPTHSKKDAAKIIAEAGNRGCAVFPLAKTENMQRWGLRKPDGSIWYVSA